MIYVILTTAEAILIYNKFLFLFYIYFEVSSIVFDGAYLQEWWQPSLIRYPSAAEVCVQLIICNELMLSVHKLLTDNGWIESQIGELRQAGSDMILDREIKLILPWSLFPITNTFQYFYIIHRSTLILQLEQSLH